MKTVREINDAADLEPLRPAWDALLEQTVAASYCQTLDWLLAFCNHYAAGKRLRVLVVENRREVIGILPLIVWAAHPREPLPALTYPLDYWTDSYGPIGPDPLATLAAGLDHVRRTPRDWHFIELAWVDEVIDQGRTRQALERAGFPVACERTGTNAVVDLAGLGSWKAYLASRSKNQRKHMRHNENRLARRGKVRFLRYRRADDNPASPPRWDLYDTCETISHASWQGLARKGTMLTKEVDRGFFRECFQRACLRGGVDLDLLFVDDRPAAFGYRYYYRGRVTGVKAGYLSEFAAEGAGSVLRARAIEESFARGDSLIEFGDEFLDQKQAWMTHSRPIYRYIHFPRRLGAQLIRAKRALARRGRGLLALRRGEMVSPDAPLAPAPASGGQRTSCSLTSESESASRTTPAGGA